MQRASSDIAFRVARVTDHPRIEAGYSAWGYRGGVSPDDTLFVAERGGELVAAVRRTHEHAITLLRGMYVAPAHQRRGVGSGLLTMFVEHLHGRACYCVPYQHLRAFYSRAGFLSLPGDAAPDFLRERLSSYRTRGLDVLVMHRPSTSSVQPRERPNQAMQRTADCPYA
jgi:predicted N-acetyltransferase YhbS